MKLTKNDVLQFANVFQSLPKGNSTFTYAMALNYCRLVGVLQQLSAEINPSAAYREYLQQARANPEECQRLSETYKHEIELQRQKTLDRQTILAEEIDLNLRQVAATDAPLSELTPAQLAAIMPFITEDEE